MSILSKVKAWLDERLHMGEYVGPLMRKPLSGGARYIFSLGSVNLFLFINQVLTGMFLMIYYVPSPDHAYDAVKFIQEEAAMGNIVRGLHYWGASAMIVSVILHALRVYTWGAYKKPREVMWLSGTFLLLLVFAFAFTGYLLPWDQKAYWATVVGTNVPGTTPVVGGYIVRLLRGGAEVSNLTLTRFFTLHTMILPWTLALIAGIHLTVLQVVDHTPPWDPEKAKVTAPFYPDQAFKDAVSALFAFALVMLLANLSPAGLDPVADPTDKTYNPRPEWYFYFLFQLLHYTQGKYEIIGTVIIPNVFLIFMLLLPFMDRNPSRAPKKRPVSMAAMGAVVAGYIVLTVLAIPPRAVGVTTAAATEGRQLYAKLGCASCHSIGGVGGKVGPPLDGVGERRDRAWLIEHFKDPRKLVPGSVMPKYDYLPAEQLDALTDYMQSLR